MGLINFDHSYTEDLGHKFLKILERAGFSLMAEQVEHPGKQFCRFIMFNKAGSGKKKRKGSYLEFVDIGRGGERINKPGLSLRYEGSLKKHFSSLKNKCGIKADYIHKNYNWKEESKRILPGWNFITFKRPRFKNIYLWFTEYELRPGIKKLPKISHRNTAESIYGLELCLKKSDQARLGEILKKNVAAEELDFDGLKLFLKKSVQTKISSIIVSCRSLKHFENISKISAKYLWRGEKAAIIKNPDKRMWDIIVVEKH